MPVRIYEISKKLGLENKEVLTKAKELGIAAARVASSSLDKITAEYLEDQLKLVHPDWATRTAPPSAPAVPEPFAPPQPEAPVSPVPARVVEIAEASAPLQTAEVAPPAAAPPEQPYSVITVTPASPTVEIVKHAPAPTPVVEPFVVPVPVPEPAATEPEFEVAVQCPPPPTAPPVPIGPKLGDKVGFIQLPPK